MEFLVKCYLLTVADHRIIVMMQWTQLCQFCGKSKRMIDKVINIYTMFLDYCGYKFIKTERGEDQSKTSLNVNVRGF